MAYIMVDKPDERVRKIRLQVDTEWVSLDFGRKIDRAAARERLLQYVDALFPTSVDRSPEGEKPQPLNAKHESAVGDSRDAQGESA